MRLGRNGDCDSDNREIASARSDAAYLGRHLIIMTSQQQRGGSTSRPKYFFSFTKCIHKFHYFICAQPPELQLLGSWRDRKR